MEIKPFQIWDEEECQKQGLLNAALAVRRNVMMASEPGKTAWATDLLKTMGPSSSGTVVPTSGDTMTALIDGDLIAYRAAAATNGNFYRVKKETTKYYKDALRIALKYTKGDEDKAKVIIHKESNPEPVSHAVHNMQKMLNNIQSAVERRYRRPVDLDIFLTSDVLFRDDISPNYKKSREGTVRPVNLLKCKEYLTNHKGAQTIHGYEADDMLAMYATELGPTDCVVVSLDKDLLQIPGDHYNFVKDSFETVCEHQARQNFWTQVLMGDKTDDIPGLHGVGPVTAKKILKPLHADSTELDYYRAVLKEWLQRSTKEPEESEADFYTRIIKDLSKSARMLWLCREPEVIWDPPVSVSKDIAEAE